MHDGREFGFYFFGMNWIQKDGMIDWGFGVVVLQVRPLRGASGRVELYTMYT
jgi:hypothetical protein